MKLNKATLIRTLFKCRKQENCRK